MSNQNKEWLLEEIAEASRKVESWSDEKKAAMRAAAIRYASSSESRNSEYDQVSAN